MKQFDNTTPHLSTVYDSQILNALLNAYEMNVKEERRHMIRQWELLSRISPKFSQFNKVPV